MTNIWTIDPERTSFDGEQGFDDAVALLRSGELVAVPTETVYGLAADATNDEAVAAIFEAKERPRFNPLICHLDCLASAERYAVLDDRARLLAETFWPGPLTLVVEARSGSGLSDLVTAGLGTVAIRIPDAPVMRCLSAALRRPLAAPSANRSGRVSATTAKDVVTELGDRVSLVIDAGPCPVGIESTIVSTVDSTPVLLRPGGIPKDRLEEVLGESFAAPVAASDAPAAPGMLASHYAPKAAMRLDIKDVLPGEALLAFGPDLPPNADNAVKVENLSETGDLREAARNLFRMMRSLDEDGAATIGVMAIPPHGLGEAIRDRLQRAAAPRTHSPR